MPNINVCIKSSILGRSCEEKRSVARSFRGYGAFGRCLAKHMVAQVLNGSAVERSSAAKLMPVCRLPNWVISQHQRSQRADTAHSHDRDHDF
jgi:hypothetical protein